MQTFITVLITILVFGVIIFIHELGHFIAAKLSGITVHEFALGMGPTIFHFEKGGTKYALRLFPIGGFVSMEGEDSESEDEGAFCKKPVWKRIIVVVAGAVMNVLLGFVILMLLNTFRTGGIPTTVIKQFNGTAPYAVEESGLKVGDKILLWYNERWSKKTILRVEDNGIFFSTEFQLLKADKFIKLPAEETEGDTTNEE